MSLQLLQYKKMTHNTARATNRHLKTALEASKNLRKNGHIANLFCWHDSTGIRFTGSKNIEKIFFEIRHDSIYGPRFEAAMKMDSKSLSSTEQVSEEGSDGETDDVNSGSRIPLCVLPEKLPAPLRYVDN